MDIDRVKAKSMGYRSPTSLKRCKLTSARFTSTISTDLAVRRVMAQADAPFRMQQEDIGLLKVRNAKGEMIRLALSSRLCASRGQTESSITTASLGRY
ncbi:hypothetical protein JT306_12185 [Salmonella enterica subsp. enterica serovar Kentucky]|nr:hypothetical protein [Salmonella enterica subsp. enterica serovar Kentucky]